MASKFKWLNPSQRAKRYANQLKQGKVVETNKALTQTDRKYREGYLDARRHNAEAWCKKNGVVSKSQERRKKYFAQKNAQKSNATPKETKKKLEVAPPKISNKEKTSYEERAKKFIKRQNEKGVNNYEICNSISYFMGLSKEYAKRKYKLSEEQYEEKKELMVATFNEINK